MLILKSPWNKFFSIFATLDSDIFDQHTYSLNLRKIGESISTNLIFLYVKIDNINSIKIEKFGVFCKVLNKQFIEKLRAIFIIYKTQLHTPTDCFTFWRDHQGS